MKTTDFLVAGVVALLVGMAAFFITNQFLLTPDRFKANIEVINPIDESFDTKSSKELFTSDFRVDFSREVILNEQRNPQPFASGE